jgi:hypothetical protein
MFVYSRFTIHCIRLSRVAPNVAGFKYIALRQMKFCALSYLRPSSISPKVRSRCNNAVSNKRLGTVFELREINYNERVDVSRPGLVTPDEPHTILWPTIKEFDDIVRKDFAGPHSPRMSPSPFRLVAMLTNPFPAVTPTSASPIAHTKHHRQINTAAPHSQATHTIDLVADVLSLPTVLVDSGRR